MTRLGLTGALEKQMTQITMHKGGTAEKTITVESTSIPDCWHAAMSLLDAGLDKQSEMVLECWYLAHAFKNHIETQNSQHPSGADLFPKVKNF